MCAPRVLGYQFNPASFWYFYDGSRCLQAVLVEVNNTFGERRLYWCPATENKHRGDTGSTGRSTEAQTELQHAWRKDFHVSPFNSRKGSYALSALDPFAIGRDSNHLIDNRITLLSNHGRAKLVARARSVAEPLDPASMSTWATLWLLTAWWWVGLATFPRIVFEAVQLYFTHRLHVWFRPEVRPTTIALEPTLGERSLEKYFHKYLASLSQQLPVDTALCYEPPFQPSTGDKQQTWHATSSDAIRISAKTIIIQVTSPAFYSRMVYYTSVLDAVFSEGVYCRDENRTVHVEYADELRNILQHAAIVSPIPTGLRWQLVTRLRGQPPQMSYPARDHDSQHQIKEAGGTPTELDKFIISQCSSQERRIYQRILFGMFVRVRFWNNLRVLFIATGLALGSLYLYAHGFFKP